MKKILKYVLYSYRAVFQKVYDRSEASRSMCRCFWCFALGPRNFNSYDDLYLSVIVLMT